MICCLACSQHNVRYHATETAMLKVLSDILCAVDTGDLSVLALRDLPAAFDTVDHVFSLQSLLRLVLVDVFLIGSDPISPTECKKFFEGHLARH